MFRFAVSLTVEVGVVLRSEKGRTEHCIQLHAIPKSVHAIDNASEATAYLGVIV